MTENNFVIGHCYKLCFLSSNEVKNQLYDINNIYGKDYGWTTYNPNIPFVFLKNSSVNFYDECHEFYSLELNIKVLVYKAHFINRIHEVL